MRQVAKAVARLLLGEYACYRILQWRCDAVAEGAAQRDRGAVEVDRECIEGAGDELIRTQAGYAGEGAFAYACFESDRIVAICFYWHGERYRKRNFWPLADGEAKLVQIVTLPECRGRGLASSLIVGSADAMAERGFRTLFARVWHSNWPSMRAFERAGWRRIATVFEARPLGYRWRRVRLETKRG